MNSDFQDFKKSQIHQTRCVVCGKIFNSLYLELLEAFPIFHIISKEEKEQNPNTLNCENIFYEVLLEIYVYMREQATSVSANALVNQFEWDERILMKKEMLTWCMARGYLALDDMQRLIIPQAVEETCKDMFDSYSLNSPEVRSYAIDMLKAAFRCIRESLQRIPLNQMPFQKTKADRGESTLYSNIATDQVELKRDKEGMITAPYTGASDYSERSNSTRRKD